MIDGFRVFVVDDDPLFLHMLEAILAEDCKVETFPSAQACLARLSSVQPDMFIVDVSMPEMDGFTLCRRLKDDFETSDIPLAFISASDDLDTRLSCYEAGGDDFILKPFEPEELQRKIRVAQRILSQKRALHEQAGFAQRAAMSAMTSMGELGVVLQFLSRSFACNSAREVSEAVLAALAQYDLLGAMQVRLADQEFSLSPNGQDLPLEVGILNHVRNAGRIFQFSSRCVFNYGRLTLMINNMPLEDADRAGRIRDNVALLAEGADARLHAIEVESANTRRQQGIAEALPRLYSALDSVQGSYRRNCFQLTQVMIEFQEALLKSYVHLGLTEEQEDYMTRLAGGFMQRMVDAQDQSMEIVGELEGVARNLEGLSRS